ncbi:MAG: zinc-ribbon domain-containing protein [Rubrivivax sp.]|nr:zinc-ribbon domain-containing protein [Rubrivivax sp.]
MSLATRCTSCGTVFRVVQDQLRVSSGWVRCGRCSEVFNAIESLVDLELDRPGEGAAASVHGSRVMQDLARVAAGTAEPPVAPAPMREPVREPMGEPIAADDPFDVVIDPPGPALAAEPETGLPPDRLPLPPIAAPDRAQGDAQTDAQADTQSPVPGRAPTFLRQADRAARWRHPGVRAGLSLGVLVALAGLGWQVHLSQHDWLVARWPVLRAPVAQLCAWSGCQIEPPRRIESLAVESSGLTRAGAAGTYKLTAVLRNRDKLPLRTPAVDLTLTDATGRVIARRVLDAAELGAPQPSIAAGGELALAATLRTRDAAVVGYTIEIFYP